MKKKTSKVQVDQLLQQAYEFSFFQAIRLLRQACRQEPKQADIRVRPKLFLGFPAADIDRVTVEKNNDRKLYCMTANFLGLYGVSSPLPIFYTEDLIEERAQDESVSRDFLDIFNHRLYDLLFECWRKYRLFFQVNEYNDQTVKERLYCLLGLGSGTARKEMDNSRRLLRYLGLFTQFPRSATGLSTLLSDALKNVPITIIPCIARKARIAEDQRFSLGRANCRLGGNSYLGNQVRDRMGKFRIRIGPLDQEKFLFFTPGNPGYSELAELTSLYLNQPLECEAELVMAPGQAQTTCLGKKPRACLGVNTWVFGGHTIDRQMEIRFAVRQPQTTPAPGTANGPAEEERIAS